MALEREESATARCESKLCERCFGLVESRNEKAGIEPREHFAAMHLTVIVNVQLRNRAGGLGSD